MGIDRRKRKGGQRDGHTFLALPHIVLDSAAFQSLSHPARSLLLELGRQLGTDNNGRLLLTMEALGPRGWKSFDTIARAKAELLDRGLVFQTVQGCRPSKASWYAITWAPLARLDGYDPGAAAAFERSAYLKFGALPTLKSDPRRTV